MAAVVILDIECGTLHISYILSHSPTYNKKLQYLSFGFQVFYDIIIIIKNKKLKTFNAHLFSPL